MVPMKKANAKPGERSCCRVETVLDRSIMATSSKESLGSKPPFTSSSGSGHAIMSDPKKYYTPELQKFTRAKIKKIGCPVFIAYGNVSKINRGGTRPLSWPFPDTLVLATIKEGM